MIVRKTVVDQIEVTRYNTVQVRMAKLLVDGDDEIHSAWHRTVIPFDIDPRAQMEEVNRHLAELGEAQVSGEDIDKVVVVFNSATGRAQE